jgi:pyruvate dehydrogenase E2 component (dihydrolipoamide acetyltransferase)
MAEIVTMPKLGFDMAEGVLVRWVVDVGAGVEKGDLLAEIETDKATVEVESPYSGTVLKHIVPEDSVVPINDPIAVIGESGEDISSLSLDGPQSADGGAGDEPQDSAQEPAPETREMEAAPEGTSLPEGVRATPLARNMARVEGIDISRVSGSGPKGRITKKDIEAFLAAPKAEAAPSLGKRPAFAQPEREDTTVKLTRLRQAIGRRMTESKQWYPHFYVTYEYDLDALMAARKQANAGLAEKGVKLSVNDFIVKAAAMTLRDFPNLNATLGEGEVYHHGHINIGIAVAVEGGLLIVVVPDADSKPLSQISAEVLEKAGRVREGKVHPDDVSGSTFTTSNLGMYGVDDFTAIINPPEAAILALGAARQVPVVRDGQLAVGWRMKATISVDHRVSDGAEAADYMRAMAQYLEQPILMLV